MDKNKGSNESRFPVWLIAISILPALVAVIFAKGPSAERGVQGPRLAKVDFEKNQTSPPEGGTRSSGEAEVAGQHPLDPVLELARQSLSKFESDVVDYTATLSARERIKGVLGEQSVMEIKVIDGEASDDAASNPPEKPLHAYVKFVEPKSKAGREVIYVAGANDNKLIAHEAGFLNLVRANLAPTGFLAMQGTKYPIYDLGLATLLRKLIEKGERDRETGGCVVNRFDDEVIGNRECELIQVVHPDQDDRYEFHIAEIYFDKELLIPLKYASYLWPENTGEEPPLEEEYIYTDVILNPGLTEKDFDPDNPEYNYP